MHFVSGDDAGNAEGVESFSPELQGTSYPWFGFKTSPTLKGLKQSASVLAQIADSR
jgi:hypothetical protein